VAGYNVQIAVDSKHKLLVAQEVTQDGNDSQQLAPMLAKAQDILPADHLTGFADGGYYDGNPLKSCEQQNITVYVAIPDKSKAIAAQGRYTREQFHYDAQQDPPQPTLIAQRQTTKKRQKPHPLPKQSRRLPSMPTH
jgi:hypothetical protein